MDWGRKEASGFNIYNKPRGEKVRRKEREIHLFCWPKNILEAIKREDVWKNLGRSIESGEEEFITYYSKCNIQISIGKNRSKTDHCIMF